MGKKNTPRKSRPEDQEKTPSEKDASLLDKYIPEEILEAIPEEKRTEFRSLLVEHHHSGPLPPASEIARYEEIMPGFADRLMKQVEKQSTHRQSQEETIVRRRLNQSAIGLWLGAFTTTLLVAAGTYLTTLGHTTTSTAIFSVTVIGLAAVFIKDRSMMQKENETVKQEM